VGVKINEHRFIRTFFGGFTFPEMMAVITIVGILLNPSANPPDSSVLMVFRAGAVGDIDGDRNYSLFERFAVITISDPTLMGSPIIFSIDELA